MEVSVVEYEKEFEKVFAKGNVCLKFIGLKLDSKDGSRNFINRLSRRWLYILIILSMNVDVVGQLTWLIGTFINGNGDFIDVTFLLPCLSLSLMGFTKSYSFLKNVHHIHEVISTLKKLKTTRLNTTRSEDEFEKKSVQFLNAADTVIKFTTILGLTIFGIGPLLIICKIFYDTGEVKLLYPFLFYYPFNAYDIRVYPFLYAQQLWSATVTVCTIWGPDYICYAMATYLFIHNFSVKQDIINLIPKSSNRELLVVNYVYRMKLRDIVQRHNDLLRCANLLEVTYTKTILVNVVCGSILICCNVFNMTANDNIAVRAPSIVFLAMVLGQIFLLCYFGDMIMRSSMEISDAIYTSRWYTTESSIVKDLIIICLRANKPSKLTAYGYSDVNLRTFTKILSTSWSYLTLLQTIYNKNKA